MKLSRILIVLILLVAPNTFAANNKLAAERAWKPFFTAFRAAVRKRDRVALRKMMSSDFFSSPGNGEGIDAAFQYWDDPKIRGWHAFNRVLNLGTVPMAAWWNHGAKRKYITRIAPPAANVRRNIDRGVIDWYAFFEFRDGRWYCTIFSDCCD
ncbi:MAG TPA: hypothetical protein VHE60_01305 [Pyrinomonadaceae bacterium]|nr:hypothetical protein [Pyrinomonadaceae bacterium]